MTPKQLTQALNTAQSAVAVVHAIVTTAFAPPATTRPPKRGPSNAMQSVREMRGMAVVARRIA